MSNINDEVLGTLVFDRGWTKEENFKWWGYETRLKVIVSAYENETVNIKQREGYVKFKNNIINISNDSLIKTKEYIEIIKDEILAYIDFNEIPDNILKIVKPNSIMILESGNIGVLCDCSWDAEQGIAILIDNNGDIEVGPEDIIWE